MCRICLLLLLIGDWRSWARSGESTDVAERRRSACHADVDEEEEEAVLVAKREENKRV